jgi:prepilin-type N-terminal cleavage/methylation domain-containing protein
MNNRKAFTLLEILISVVVLAIGLVGVVAIFPAVIDLQRRAQDTVIGVAAASSAEAQLTGTFVESESVDWVDWEGFYGTNNFPTDLKYSVIEILKRDGAISERDARLPVGAPNAILDFLWDASWEGERPRNQDTIETLESTGDLILGGGTAISEIAEDTGEFRLPTHRLDLGERLMPDGSTEAPPRYVYDMVIRRVDVGIGVVPRGDRRRFEKSIPRERLGEVPVQIAIFTRRIDRNIRLPKGVSLRDSFVGSRDVDTDDMRYPLAVLANDRAQPVNNAKMSDGGLIYSRPIEAKFQGSGATLNQSDTDSNVFDLLDPESLRVASGIEGDSVTQSLTQVGQMFVDNQGVVRTVTEFVEMDVAGSPREMLVIDPPFSTNDFEVFQQIVFTPQVPVGIRVVTTR